MLPLLDSVCDVLNAAYVAALVLFAWDLLTPEQLRWLLAPVDQLCLHVPGYVLRVEALIELVGAVRATLLFLLRR